jgi:hypothetical protein
MTGTNFCLWLLNVTVICSMLKVATTTRNDVAFVSSNMYRETTISSKEENRILVVLALGKSQQRQIELLRKLETIKQEELNRTDVNVTATSAESRLTLERSEFSQLLANYKPTNFDKEDETIIQRPSSYDTGNIGNIANPILKTKQVTKQQSNKKIVRASSPPSVVSNDVIENDDRPFQVGDIAKRKHFETLVNVHTKQVVGPMGAAKLVPWVPPYLYRTIIIVVDPRKQSGDFRTAIQYLISNHNNNNNNNNNNRENDKNIIAITADTIEEITPLSDTSCLMIVYV